MNEKQLESESEIENIKGERWIIWEFLSGGVFGAGIVIAVCSLIGTATQFVTDTVTYFALAVSVLGVGLLNVIRHEIYSEEKIKKEWNYFLKGAIVVGIIAGGIAGADGAGLIGAYVGGFANVLIKKLKNSPK